MEQEGLDVKLVRLEGKVDLYNNKIENIEKFLHSFAEGMKDNNTSTDKRLIRLERFESKMIGVGLVIAFLSSLATAGIIAMFKNM